VRPSGGSYLTQSIGVWQAGVSWQNVQLADVHGDGRLDVVGWSLANGQCQSLQFDGSTFATQLFASWDPTIHWTDVLVGDLNGDGRADMAGRDPATGDWVGLMSSNTQYRSVTFARWRPGVPYNHVQVVAPRLGGPVDIVGWDPTTSSWLGVVFAGSVNLLSNLPHGSQVLATWSSGMDWQNILVGAVPGKSDATLRRLILNEVPGLRAALVNQPLEAARLLDSWSANAAPFSLSRALAQATEAGISSRSAAANYYDLLLPNRGAVYCSGEATFFSQVLNLFGFDAFKWGFGDLVHGVTHTTTIVPLWQSGTWHYYIFDPTCNVQFHDARTGAYLTIFDMMDDVSGGHADRIALAQGSVDARNWLDTTFLRNPAADDFVLQGVTNGFSVYRRQHYSLLVYLSTYQKELQAGGFATGVPGLVQLMTTPTLLLGTPPDPSVLQPFLAELQARGVSGNP
jgi:hypothetical protein